MTSNRQILDASPESGALIRLLDQGEEILDHTRAIRQEVEAKVGRLLRDADIPCPDLPAENAGEAHDR